jgi:branched-chain amino acid transport system substrate-binding protein
MELDRLHSSQPHFAMFAVALASSANIWLRKRRFCGFNTGKPRRARLSRSVPPSAGPDPRTSAPRASKAYFDCVNANGGVNGRPRPFAKRVFAGWPL